MPSTVASSQVEGELLRRHRRGDPMAAPLLQQLATLPRSSEARAWRRWWARIALRSLEYRLATVELLPLMARTRDSLDSGPRPV